jgi:hypothetical protein
VYSQDLFTLLDMPLVAVRHSESMGLFSALRIKIADDPYLSYFISLTFLDELEGFIGFTNVYLYRQDLKTLLYPPRPQTELTSLLIFIHLASLMILLCEGRTLLSTRLARLSKTIHRLTRSLEGPLASIDELMVVLREQQYVLTALLSH